MYLGEKRGAHLGNGSGHGAQCLDRTELPADHRHHGDGNEDGRRQIRLGTDELGVRLLEKLLRCRGGHLSRCQIRLDLLEHGQAVLVMAIRRQRPHPEQQRPNHHHQGDGTDDQPPTSPLSIPRVAHGDHSSFQAPPTESADIGTVRGAADKSPMVPEPWPKPWSAETVPQKFRSGAASIPGCHSRPSEWQLGGLCWSPVS